MKVKSKKWSEREELKTWRNKVLERDNFKCQICQYKPSKPHVHHIIPKQDKELRYDINNGITLCFNHHKVGLHSPHQNSLFFSEWLKINKPNQFEYLLRRINETN